MMKLLVIFFFSSCACLKIAKDSESKKQAPKTAHIYFTNLKDRPDRCNCMKQQLANSPYEVFRQAAVNPINFVRNCPGVVVGGDTNPHQQAVTCSKQIVYDRINRSETKADFFIIMEDDLQIHNLSHFWTQLHGFLESDCTKEVWDMIAVDTFNKKFTATFPSAVQGRRRKQEKPLELGLNVTNSSCAATNGSFFSLKETQSIRWGAHLLIVKPDAIPKLLNQSMHNADDFTSFAKDGIQVRFWQPNLVGQMSAGPERQSLAKTCVASVAKSDNVWFRSWKSTRYQNFDCPSE